MMRLRVLGCGSSAGVPRVGLGWGVCDPANPKNRRRRCSVLVERSELSGVTRVLVDTTPDVRVQLLDADVPDLDGILYTHAHADHLHGIDDVRTLVMKREALLDTYMDEPTSAVVRRAFDYLFECPAGSLYPPLLRERRISAGNRVVVEGRAGPIAALPMLFNHGEIDALGFRFGDVAYTPDLVSISPESAAMLEGLDVWIVDALRYREHPTHFCVADALAWISKLNPRRAILTNLSSEVDFETLRRELPPGVEPAFDGMVVAI